MCICIEIYSALSIDSYFIRYNTFKKNTNQNVSWDHCKYLQGLGVSLAKRQLLPWYQKKSQRILPLILLK